jgi:hypothetical protein
MTACLKSDEEKCKENPSKNRSDNIVRLKETIAYFTVNFKADAHLSLMQSLMAIPEFSEQVDAAVLMRTGQPQRKGSVSLETPAPTSVTITPRSY